jgi:hypothetical protein
MVQYEILPKGTVLMPNLLVHRQRNEGIVPHSPRQIASRIYLYAVCNTRAFVRTLQCTVYPMLMDSHALGGLLLHAPPPPPSPLERFIFYVIG